LIFLIDPDFYPLFDRLPDFVQKQAFKTIDLLGQNPKHPSLNLKKVTKNPSIYSIRVNKTCRILAEISGETLSLFWIGHHDQYEKLIKKYR
jgi:hypothetical protein